MIEALFQFLLILQTAAPQKYIYNEIKTIEDNEFRFQDPVSLILESLLCTSVITAGGRSGLAVACLTAVREVPGSNRAVGSCVYHTTTVIYSLGHGLCAPFQQCLGQLSLPPSVGR